MNRPRFQQFAICEGVLQLKDELGFCATLVTGSRGALLFDSMGGLGNIREYVEGITSLPVTLINSHIHFDHNGGNRHFESAYISPLDMPYNVFGTSLEKRTYLADCLAEYSPNGLSPQQREAILQSEFNAYLPLEEGRVFELGGLSAQAAALPGHTPGSMGLLIPERRLLLSGDAMTSIMCLFFPESLPLNVYRDTLSRAMELPFDRFITGHMTQTLPKECLKEFMEAADAAPGLRGMRFVFDILPIYGGRLHLYRGGEAGGEPLGVILKETAR